MTIRYHHDHHDHAHSQSPADPGEIQAVLTYLLEHNRHHAEELHELAHGVQPEEAAELIHEAVELFTQGNNRLEQALQLMK